MLHWYGKVDVTGGTPAKVWATSVIILYNHYNQKSTAAFCCCGTSFTGFYESRTYYFTVLYRFVLGSCNDFVL